MVLFLSDSGGLPAGSCSRSIRLQSLFLFMSREGGIIQQSRGGTLIGVRGCALCLSSHVAAGGDIQRSWAGELFGSFVFTRSRIQSCTISYCWQQLQQNGRACRADADSEMQIHSSTRAMYALKSGKFWVTWLWQKLCYFQLQLCQMLRLKELIPKRKKLAPLELCFGS